MTKIVLYPSGSGTNPLAGSIINCDATEVTHVMNPFVQIQNTPGKYTGSDWNFRLAKPKYMGFENPVVTIAGLLDTKNISYKGGTNPDSDSNLKITGSMIWGLASAGTICLIDDLVLPVNPTYATIRGKRVSRNPNSATTNLEADKGYILDYNMEFVEVQV